MMKNCRRSGTVRIVELSHHLHPGQEEYKLEVDNRFVEELLPEYERPPDAWYVMSEVRMWSHVGTHMESPFHYLKDGVDVASISLEHVVGEGVLVDFTDRGVGASITLEDMEERGQDIREGDILFVRTGLSHNYRTPRSHDRPYFAIEAIRWLVEKGISCLGVDCSGIEKRDVSTQPCHQMLFQHGIPLIEHLANLEQLTRMRFFVVAVPWRVHGLEASPVSVIAFESDDAG
jgi:arylformamidase